MAMTHTPKSMLWLFLGGLLIFATVGIARGAIAANRSMIGRSMQSNISAAVAVTVAPTAVQGTWLKIQVAAGARWIFADNWYSCAHMSGGEYTVGAGYDVTGWPNNDQFQALPLGIRQEMEGICHE